MTLARPRDPATIDLLGRVVEGANLALALQKGAATLFTSGRLLAVVKHLPSYWLV